MTNSTDWEQHYQTQNMPWEKGEAAPGLVDFITQRAAGLTRGSVCVPGCGTGHDVRTWAAAGFTTTGVDIAPSAVKLAQERTIAAGLKADFLLGDFLQDTPPQPFDWIFEHTCFCAIQPAQRAAYVAAVKRWLRPSGNYLAVNYLIDNTDGPPFGVTRAELIEWFAPHFRLREEWVPRSYPNRTNLELMLWWQLT